MFVGEDVFVVEFVIIFMLVFVFEDLVVDLEYNFNNVVEEEFVV